jgi:hypothetical protein
MRDGVREEEGQCRPMPRFLFTIMQTGKDLIRIRTEFAAASSLEELVGVAARWLCPTLNGAQLITELRGLPWIAE